MSAAPPRDRLDRWTSLLLGGIGFVMLLVIARVVQLKVDPDPRLWDVVDAGVSRRTDTARRGGLLDRRGRMLATSTMGKRLFVDPTKVDDVETIAADLAHLIGEDPVPIDRRIQTRLEKQYVRVSDVLAGWQVEAVRAAGLRGVGLESCPERHYPAGDVAAALVGAVGFDHQGLTGMEHHFQRDLESHAGVLRYRRDARRAALWVEPTGFEPATNGGDVRLSIDLTLQRYAETRLSEAVEHFNAGGGRVIVADCRTGEILAMHDVLRSREDWDEQTEDPARLEHPSLGRNRCVTDPYEPGSTFKPFVWAIATELGHAAPDEVLPTPTEEEGPYRTPYGRRVRDDHYDGPSTWSNVLVRSLNSGMCIISERLSHAEMQSVIRRFGFGERTGCQLPGESRGLVQSTSNWRDHTQSSVSFGHEIAVTPIQMVRAFSAIACDGAMPSPRLTALPEGTTTTLFKRRAMSSETARVTREVLHKVMTEGSGQRFNSERYPWFGKSGTAQLPRRDGKGYHEYRYVSSFIAGAPVDDPQVVVLCVIDDPDRKKGHYGSVVAGPAVRDMLEYTLGYLGVRSREAVAPSDGDQPE